MGAPNYKAIFAGIANAKPMNNFAARIPSGKHRVVITYYGVKESERGKGSIIELETNLLATGEKRGWAWFPQLGGAGSDAAGFQSDRARRFLQAVKDSIESAQTLDDIAMSLADTAQHGKGVILDVEITQVFEKDGTTPVRGKNGEPIFNDSWSAVRQSLADRDVMRGKLEKGEAVAAASAASTSANEKSTLLGLG